MAQHERISDMQLYYSHKNNIDCRKKHNNQTIYVEYDDHLREMSIAIASVEEEMERLKAEMHKLTVELNDAYQESDRMSAINYELQSLVNDMKWEVKVTDERLEVALDDVDFWQSKEGKDE